MQIEAATERLRMARHGQSIQALQTASYVGQLLSKRGLQGKEEYERLDEAFKARAAETAPKRQTVAEMHAWFAQRVVIGEAKRQAKAEAGQKKARA